MIQITSRLKLCLIGLCTLAASEILLAQMQPAAPTTPPASAPASRPARPARPERPPVPPADEPAMKMNGRRPHGAFMDMHRQFLDRIQQGPVDLLFLGDSITEWWTHAPEVWDKYYGQSNGAAFGIAGDQTQHVLWRITNGELDNIHPKVVIIMIGTNNGDHTPGQVAQGITKIVQTVREKLPESRVLLLAIFPRGTDPNDPETIKTRGRLAETNQVIARLDDGDHVRFLDLSPKFVELDAGISKDVMADGIHPTAKGYEIWAEAMKPLLDEMTKP